MTLQPWQEIRGLVRDVEVDGLRVRIVLQDGADVFALRMATRPRGPPIQVGLTIAILRLDAPPEYVVRILD